MRIGILFKFNEKYGGGGNTFLKNLRDVFIARGVYDSVLASDVIIANSYHYLEEAILLKLLRGVKVVHRLDGIFYYHRGEQWREMDQLILRITEDLFDGAVFQSNWCRTEAEKLGFKKNNHWTVINNASDGKVFYRGSKNKRGDKVKLINTFWSDNVNKGFDFYNYLDQKLDFTKYTVTLIGNCRMSFKNITVINAINNVDIAVLLREHDIYLTAGKNEACSNSLVEALSCRLPVVALDSGSNRELIKTGGEYFNSLAEMMEKIELVAANLEDYHGNVVAPDLEAVADQYYDFMAVMGNQKMNKILMFKYLFKLVWLRTKIKYF